RLFVLAGGDSIRIADAGVRRGIVGVEEGGLLKIFKSLADAFRRELKEKVASLEIKLICLGILGVAFGQLLRFSAGQLEAQSGGDALRDFLLHYDQVGEAALVPLSPEMAAVAGIHQFRADRKRVAALRDMSGEHGANAQSSRNVQRVALLLFEAVD